MQYSEPINETLFASILERVKLPANIDRHFLYEIYLQSIDSIGKFSEKNHILEAQVINHIDVILYIVSEHLYHLSGPEHFEENKLIDNEGYQSLLLSAVVDKYLTNNHLDYRTGSGTSRFYPPISTLSLYLNFVLGMLSRLPKNDPSKTLVVDIMTKAFTIGKCVVDLLVGGFETEAFATWRTLHETECVLKVLSENGEKVQEAYLRHLTYGVAFRQGLGTVSSTDAIFQEIKIKMKKQGLKSKDMKRFIEYGWLDAIAEFNLVDYKYNFRDGLEAIAKLKEYSRWYEMSSEVAHSSPVLIYASSRYFGSVTLINLFESFFRMEKTFSEKLDSTLSESERANYQLMRQIHFRQMEYMHNREKANFLKEQEERQRLEKEKRAS